MSDESKRLEAWRSKFHSDDAFGVAKAGRGHHAVARLVASGKMTTLITQTTDGLYRDCGVPDDALIELYGNETYGLCTCCGIRHELSDLRERFQTSRRSPTCLCGGLIKPGALAFREPLSRRNVCRAIAAVETCDLLLVVGSISRIFPMDDLPIYARERGASLVIINREPAPVDAIADLVIREDVGDVLETFIDYEAQRPAP